MSVMDGGIHQDEQFAKRLKHRDVSVLFDIDKAYSGSLRRLLRRWRGPKLNDHDIDAIVQIALKETWEDFSCDGGSSVRSFYFIVGKRRCIDHLRESDRLNKKFECSKPLVAIDDIDLKPSPVDNCVNAETSRINGSIMKIVDDAFSIFLTLQQAKALKRRLAAGDGEHWAKKLEKETNKPAKQWRKTGSEAIAKLPEIRRYLEEKGVRYSIEGGRYEIARARSSA